MYICIYVYMYICIYVYMYICIYVYIQAISYAKTHLGSSREWFEPMARPSVRGGKANRGGEKGRGRQVPSHCLNALKAFVRQAG